MSWLAQIVVWLNAVANLIGRILFAPIAWLPGWASATLIAVGTGVLMLLIFKYTSNQASIKRVRDGIKANLLSLKLFKENALVVFSAQGRIFAGALKLAALAIVPMLVMVVPVTLLMAQMGLWYQARPLRPGEQAVVTLKLNGGVDSPWPKVQLQPSDAFDVTIGPVRALSERSVHWSIEAKESDYHRLTFLIGDDKTDKELAIGDGIMRVSIARPAWDWLEATLHPWERPFKPDDPVHSIDIDYPERDSWTSGADKWIVYWFGASMVAALCFRRALNVNI